MKSRYNFFLSCSIVLLVSFQYLLLSISFNEITVSIFGNNPFLTFFSFINDVFLFVYPILVFLFLCISMRFMFQIFDIKHISTYATITMVGYSNLPFLLGMIFYNVSVLFFMKEYPSSVDEIENIHFLFDLQIKDFGLINKLCWFLMYYMIFAFLYFKHKVLAHQALLSTLAPTLLFFLFSYMIKMFGSN